MLNDKFVTVSQAASLKGFTTGHLRRLIISGKLKAHKVGNGWLIPLKDLESLKRIRKYVKKD